MKTAIYSVGEDEPFTCPLDGARTEAIYDNGDLYHERCPECKLTFYFQFEDFQDDEQD